MITLQNLFLLRSSTDIDRTFHISAGMLTSCFTMSYPSIEVVCGKCGAVINKILNLKSIKDILRSSNGRCNVCGNSLNPTEFTITMEKQ